MSTGLTSQRARARACKQVPRWYCFRRKYVCAAARHVEEADEAQPGSASRLDRLADFSPKEPRDDGRASAAVGDDEGHARLAAIMFAFLQRAIGIETNFIPIFVLRSPRPRAPSRP